MAFLTDIDRRAEVKGSRDPLALVPVWSFFGRKVVGNLSTVTDSVRGFTTLLLGYYFAREIEERRGAKNDSTLSVFLRFEQLAGYSRYYFGKNSAFRGIERVKRNLSEVKRIWLSAAPDDQILSDQKVYGLWGLYSVPSRASGLLEQDETVLTQEARAFVESQYISYLSKRGFKDGQAVMNLLGEGRAQLHLDGRHAELGHAVAKILGSDFTQTERFFYRQHLMLGGPKDTTGGRQAQLVELLESVPVVNPPKLYLRRLVSEARKRGEEFEILSERLDRIDHLESLITAAAILFGFLLARSGQSITSTAGEVRKCWGSGLHHLDLDRTRVLIPEIIDALHDADSGERWLKTVLAFREGDYEGAIRLLIDHNCFVMRTRNGSEPWIRLDGAKLDVRFRDETWSLPAAEELPNLWYNNYFINPLRIVTATLREA